MPHIVADAVKETSTTTGTGNLTVAGAEPTFQPFSAVCANNDTFFYRVAHRTLNEWEVAFGTFVSATPAIARTTIIESSNADAAVNFSAGIKDVMIVSPAIAQSWGVLAPPSITSDQNDANPAGLKYANILVLTNDNVRYITGLAGGFAGRQITLHVLSTAQGPFVLRNESASSAAANRFALPQRRVWIWPGESIQFFYDPSASRWKALSAVNSVSDGSDVIDEWDDFHPGVAGNAATSEAGEFLGKMGWRVSGTGTPVNTTPASVAGHPGIIRLVTATTIGNDTRLHLGSTATDDILPFNNVQYFASIVRPVDITSNRTKFGLGIDISDSVLGGLGADGVFFEFDTATSANWRCITRAASTNTLVTSGIALANNDWDQLEAYRLTNGNWSFWINETLVTTSSTNIPTTAMANLGWFVETQVAAGRSLDIDWVRLRTLPLGQRFT